MAKLTLIRGLPGSGKSTMAKTLQNLWRYFHIEADMFHVNGNGEYEFHAENVKKAHEWCQTTCLTLLRNGYDVVVSNTFTQKWEIQPYLDMRDWCDCEIDVVEAKGDYGNVHNVPQEIIDKMRARWETL